MKPRALVVNALVWALAALAVFPLVWMVCVSLMPAGTASSLPPPLIPQHPTLEHYRVLLGDGGLKRAFVNSLVLAVVSTAVSVSFNTLAGYAFAKLRFAHRERVFGLLIAALVMIVNLLVDLTYGLIKACVEAVNTKLRLLRRTA